ncbi:leucine-rich_repeat protein [Hexamita inflata]|uniref:Leucine-rich_repeat protein n=1 Tax=Hexamita inflata TaxID=28002 RepID=A0ABP1HMJ9_9EUKA
MKPTNNKMQQLCTISDETKFTDNNVIEATRFEAEHQTLEQVDKIPMHATSLVIVCSRLCSTQGINLHVNITHLDLRGNFLQTVDLKDLVNLEYADLSANYLKEIDSISGNKKIKTLKLASNEVKNIYFIATLPQLKEFNIDSNTVQDLEPLFKHPNFSPHWASIQKTADAKIDNENARIAFWRNVNIMVVRYRDRVEFKQGHNVLSIANDQELTETVFLDYLKVTQVFVSNCHNISFTEVPKLLKQLWICSSEIKSLSGLENINQLERLTLRQCSLFRIQDQLKVTKKLQNLRYLDVAQNDISTSECICNEKLISLNVSQNKLKSLNGFGNLTNLTSLDVSGNQLNSVEELAYLTNLKELNISFNAIKSIQTLLRLVKLVYFNLICNKVLDIETCLRMNDLIDLRTKNNFIQNGYVLLEHSNFKESWLSEQLTPDTSDQEAKKLKDQVKNSNVIEKYKNQVKNNSLEIKNDQYVRSLKFSDLIGVTKELSLSKCENVSFEVVPVLAQSLKVNSSGLQNILGLEQIIQITSLELSDNLLEDVIEIQELTKLTRLVLSNNRISRLHWIQALTQLKYLDLQNNKFVSVECLKDLQSLSEVFIQGNMVQDSDYLKLLKNFSQKWISPQKEFGAKDIEYYLGPNNSPQMVKQCTARLNGAKKYLLIALKYKSNVTGSKLVIQNDANTIDLAFINYMSDLINQQIDSVSVDNCPSVLCNIDHQIQFLAITNSKLKSINNLTATSIVHLDLGFNNLEDVTAIESFTNLQKLILRDNQISRLDWIKELTQLKYLDLQNNKFVLVECLKDLQSLSEVFIQGNMVQDSDYLKLHKNFSEKWISPQKEFGAKDIEYYLGPNNSPQMVKQCTARLNGAKKYLLVAMKYKSNVTGSKLVIQNDANTIDLAFINYMSDLINQQIDSVSVDNCPSVLCNIDHQIQFLAITNSKLKSINNLTATSIVHLDLGFNNLEDVTAIESFTNLQKLILRDNQISRLDRLKPLSKLIHLDVQNNKILYLNFIRCIPLLTELLINGNCICNLNWVVEHPKCNKCVSIQRDPTLDEVQKYLGQCTQQQLDRELQAVREQIKHRDVMSQYKYAVKLQNYEKQVKTRTRITVFNVSLIESNQIYNLPDQIENCEVEEFGRNLRIECDSEKRQTVQNKIKEINSKLKLEVEEFRYLKIEKDQGIKNLSFVNAFNVHKLVIENCYCVKFQGVANVKVLQINKCQFWNLEGIQKWNQLLELNLDDNKLENVTELENLTQLKSLSLNFNEIQNVNSLKGLVNLKELDLRFNKIKNFSPIQNHTNFKNYSIGDQK